MGCHQWSQTHSCLEGMLKSTCTPPEVWDRALPPNLLWSLPLQPVSIWPCCGKCFKALAELCREKSHRWMEQCTPRAAEALHVPRHDTSLTLPALLLALGSHPANLWHSHPAAVGLGETLHWGNWDPHHIPELPNTPAEDQRCGSHPKGPRTLKRRLGPKHELWAPYKSGRLQRVHLDPHLTARGSST